MGEIITCPACQRTLQIPASYFGQTVQCPECRHQFTPEGHAEKIRTDVPPPTRAPPPAEETRPHRRRFDDDDDDDDYVDFHDDVRRIRHSNVPHRGGMILAMGLVALILFPYTTIICGPMAWLMGNSDLKEIREGRMDPSGEGLVQAGRVLGIIASVLFFGGALLFCMFFGFLVLTGRG